MASTLAALHVEPAGRIESGQLVLTLGGCSIKGVHTEHRVRGRSITFVDAQGNAACKWMEDLSLYEVTRNDASSQALDTSLMRMSTPQQLAPTMEL